MNNAAARFKEVFVLRNPVSTQASQSLQRIAEIKEFFGEDKVTVIETVAGGVEANRILLCKYARHFGPQTLVCVAAGDGTVGMVVETIVQDQRIPEKARLAAILPLWSGNANDLAHMLNGNGYRNHLRGVLQRGAVVSVYPLECTITSGNVISTRIAACYVGFGATAFAAARLNAPDVRHNRWRRVPGGLAVANFIASFRALVAAPGFALTEKGSEKIVYERTLANGSRFAKVERLPIRLTERAFLQHTIEERRLSKLLPRLWRVTQKSMASEFKQSHTEFTVGQPILAQFDGEPVEIAANTKISVSLSQQPFYALSIMLHPEQD